ncbi:galanin receptor type 3 [Onthophagus taurus]|uniref:galanin receptor type 3 n=1 Tax=Onthophagus taurus TaxID=166361 RepID=UPI000C1FDB49|nr:galanin-like G-protein coupled receptor npr-9 [Onthophagus taurus]
MDYIVSLYGCMFLVGVLANGTLGLALCTGPGAKSRSPLLLGLVAADFCVCCLSGPITAALYTITTWTQSWSNIAIFLQAWPISSCTLSMMSLSIDRYLTVKNYKPAGQVVRRRPLLLTVVLVTWLSAALFSGLQFAERNPWRRSFLMVRVTFVHIVPACTVLACHLGVHAKLTALSLTARAKHGELPLPMPLLRRPTHVIIVAGISNRLESEPRNGTSKTDNEPEEITQPPTSTLRSRRRLANAMLWISIVFALCWLPHVVCLILEDVHGSPPMIIKRYCLFLGHVHSALSPIMYWTLNHQWLQRPCKFRLPSLYRSASSTNEAALGPFHPRLVRPPPIRRRSSHYLY